MVQNNARRKATPEFDRVNSTVAAKIPKDVLIIEAIQRNFIGINLRPIKFVPVPNSMARRGHHHMVRKKPPINNPSVHTPPIHPAISKMVRLNCRLGITLILNNIVRCWSNPRANPKTVKIYHSSIGVSLTSSNQEVPSFPRHG